MEEVAGFVGRDREAEAILSAVRNGGNVLVRGRLGIGKSAMVRHCYERMKSEQGVVAIMLEPLPIKQMTLSAMEQLHAALGLAIPGGLLGPRLKAKARREGGLAWADLQRTLFRAPIVDAQEIVTRTMDKGLVVVFVDGLEVSAQKADFLAAMLDHCLMVAAIEDNNRRVRIERMLWRFQTTVELKPLPLEACEQIARNWLEQRPLRFSDKATRERFIRHVAQDSNGIPAAIRGMLEAAEQEREITPAKARGFAHEAGARYLDMTPILVVAAVVAMAFRYISRGVGEVEMLVLSGVASALFMGLRFFFWQMRAR